MSGVDLNGRKIRKGAADAVEAFVQALGGAFPADVRTKVETIAKTGGTPLVVAEDGRVLGVIHLKDIVKGGIRERFGELRAMGIKTVMITGDNPLTAAAIAAEAGVDDFLAQATPETKLKLIRDYQAGGRLVAMTGDGTNDAPALAQADVAVAMNSGTQAAKEAANLVDLDSNPDQADRDRGDRQAAPDHPGHAHHLLHRQRRGQVLRHHPRGLRHHLPGARPPQPDGAREPGRAPSSRPSSSTPSSSSSSSRWRCGASSSAAIRPRACCATTC